MEWKAIRTPAGEGFEQVWRLRWRGIWIEVTKDGEDFDLIIEGALPKDARDEVIRMWTESVSEWAQGEAKAERIWPIEDPDL